jgi:hypothetical protein
MCRNCNTHAELKEQQKKIKNLNEETAATLKRNVYRNYQQFIETSREISCILLLNSFLIPRLNRGHLETPYLYANELSYVIIIDNYYLLKREF